jgi:hypothetical protein
MSRPFLLDTFGTRGLDFARDCRPAFNAGRLPGKGIV